MKIINRIFFLAFVLALGVSCKKNIDLFPLSNLNTGTYYSNIDEIRAGLVGCYNGMQRSLFFEWQMTELRSDNTKMGVPASQASQNRDLSDLDMFMPATTHQAIYLYWLASYNNIRNCNIILDRLGVSYDPQAGSISYGAFNVPMPDSLRRQLAGEAQFIRAYHYFNLVQLYGGVFLIHTPISAEAAKLINRSSVDDIYKLIEADLRSATTNLSRARFNQIASVDIGKASAWSAKGLYAKVLLTRNRKTEAIAELQDVVTNSGYSLQASYANVFSITNEMNSEILFAVRYKAGGLGLGSSFGNDFGPLNSGSAIINGSGDGNNYPTNDLDTAFITTDARRNVNMGFFGSGATIRIYVKKYLNPVVLTDDGESDWPVLRYADILLMLAEAQGFTPASIAQINTIRNRAGLPNLDPTVVNTVATFEEALSQERRLEFAFENQRWFDLLRFGTTMSTIQPIQVLKAHFAREYARHYAQYPPPLLTLVEIQANVIPERLLLPIPQREIDTNTQLVIPQNPGY